MLFDRFPLRAECRRCLWLLARGTHASALGDQRLRDEAIDVRPQRLRRGGIEGRADVRQGKVSALVKNLEADIVFVDPPYRLDGEYQSTLAAVHADLVLVQHDVRRVLAESYGALRRTRVLRQGDNCVTFYSAPTDT